MEKFKAQFTTIKGISERRRLPRLGKIRLGVKVKKIKEDGTEIFYPKETSYFVVPPEVAAIHGEKPTELPIMIPVNDPEIIFPQYYAFYGQSKGIKCRGNGETAEFVNDKGEIDTRDCPCPKLEDGQCMRRCNFMFLLPKVSLGGIWQLDSTSYHTIVDLNSGLEYCEALVGRFAMIPLRLKRVEKETHYDGKKQKHFTLQLHLDINIDMLNALRENNRRVLEGPKYMLPAPEQVNPEFDDGAVIDIEQDSPSTQEIEGETEAVQAGETAPGAETPSESRPPLKLSPQEPVSPEGETEPESEKAAATPRAKINASQKKELEKVFPYPKSGRMFNKLLGFLLDMNMIGMTNNKLDLGTMSEENADLLIKNMPKYLQEFSVWLAKGKKVE